MSDPVFAERREPQGHDGEAIIEVFAEAPCAYGRLQVLARRREHPDIQRLASRAAKTSAPVRSSSTFEKLRLQGIGHCRPISSRKIVLAMCHLQEAGLRLPRVGERAALESEKLGFEQCVRNGCAVDVHGRRSGPRTGLVY